MACNQDKKQIFENKCVCLLLLNITLYKIYTTTLNTIIAIGNKNSVIDYWCCK